MAPRYGMTPAPVPLLPIVAATPAPPPVPQEDAIEPGKDELRHTLTAHEGRDTWRVETWRIQGDLQCGEYAAFYRDGHLIRKVYASKMGGSLLAVSKASFQTRFPIISVTMSFLQPIPITTEIYTLRRGHLIKIGKVGGENGGPIFRDYDGDGKLEWVFDDYNGHKYHEEGPEHLLVYKELKNGKLELWKILPNPERQSLPDHLGRFTPGN